MFLLELMPDVITAGNKAEFLTLLINVVKFNATYLDEEVLIGLVSSVFIYIFHSILLLAYFNINIDRDLGNIITSISDLSFIKLLNVRFYII